MEPGNCEAHAVLANQPANPRYFVYVDQTQVEPQQAATYRKDIGLWLVHMFFQPPTYINEDFTGGGLDLMLSMAGRTQSAIFAIPELTHVRGRFGDLLAVGDVYALVPALHWVRGSSNDAVGQPITVFLPPDSGWGGHR